MSTQENKMLVREFITAQHQGDLGRLEQLMGTDFRLYLPGSPEPMNRQTTKQFFAMFHAAFPDSAPTIEDQVAEGELVVTRVAVRGTHRGEFQGIPATGKHVTIVGIGIHRIADGRIVEHWPQPDLLGLLQQLGVVAAPAQVTS